MTVNEWRVGDVAAFIETYSSDNIFSMCIRLEYFTNLSQGKDDKCIEGKTSKQRITEYFCCNKSGTEKSKILIVGHSDKPHCFKNCPLLPCDYKFNKNECNKTS